MIDWSKLYDEFLYDCYIANQRLTDEDWLYYGREEHHIETPNRDGGLLTPLNSQYLTTYQHWVAGVLQSEVLGKCCFAMIPKNVLPQTLNILRNKWASANVKFSMQKRTSEQRSEAIVKGWEVRWSDPTWENGKTQRSEVARQRIQQKTPQERSEAIRKGWETRRRNQKGG